MTFWQTLKASYRGGTAVLFALPLLALVPVLFEIVQHVVEVRIGMYDSLAAAKALENHPLRTGFGLVKVTALFLPVYWVSRYLARDAGFARAAEPRALRLFAGFLVFQVALAAVQLYLLPRAGWILLATFLGGQAVGVLTAAWGVAAALGNDAVGPRGSVRIMARQLPWAFGFSLAVMLPLMIPHYALAIPPLLGPKIWLWPALIADSLLVGWLAAVLAAGLYYIAVRGAERAGVGLATRHPGLDPGSR